MIVIYAAGKSKEQLDEELRNLGLDPSDLLNIPTDHVQPKVAPQPVPMPQQQVAPQNVPQDEEIYEPEPYNPEEDEIYEPEPYVEAPQFSTLPERQVLPPRSTIETPEEQPGIAVPEGKTLFDEDNDLNQLVLRYRKAASPEEQQEIMNSILEYRDKNGRTILDNAMLHLTNLSKKHKHIDPGDSQLEIFSELPKMINNWKGNSDFMTYVNSYIRNMKRYELSGGNRGWLDPYIKGVMGQELFGKDFPNERESIPKHIMDNPDLTDEEKVTEAFKWNRQEFGMPGRVDDSISYWNDVGDKLADTLNSNPEWVNKIQQDTDGAFSKLIDKETGKIDIPDIVKEGDTHPGFYLDPSLDPTKPRDRSRMKAKMRSKTLSDEDKANISRWLKMGEEHSARRKTPEYRQDANNLENIFKNTLDEFSKQTYKPKKSIQGGLKGYNALSKFFDVANRRRDEYGELLSGLGVDLDQVIPTPSKDGEKGKYYLKSQMIQPGKRSINPKSVLKRIDELKNMSYSQPMSGFESDDFGYGDSGNNFESDYFDDFDDSYSNDIDDDRRWAFIGRSRAIKVASAGRQMSTSQIESMIDYFFPDRLRAHVARMMLSGYESDDIVSAVAKRFSDRMEPKRKSSMGSLLYDVRNTIDRYLSRQEA